MWLSVLRVHPGRAIEFHYLHGPDLTPENVGRLRAMLAPHAPRATLILHLIPDEWVDGLPLFASMKPGLVRPVMWYRLFLPRLLPDRERVLYLDADTIVVDDLDSLWSMDLQGKALAAVTNPFPEALRGWPAELGLPGLESYFNSGVMLLDLAAFRREKLDEKVLRHGIENAGRTRWGDQDSLVSVLHERRVPLDPRWNLLRLVIMAGHARELFPERVLRRAIQRPGIVHFEGAGKPWVSPGGHPYSHLYFRHARDLPWPLPPQGVAPLIRIENFLIRRQWLRLLRVVRQWARLGVGGMVRALSMDFRTVRFVQIGSNDGKVGDPLRARIVEGGWRGVLVEPIRPIFERLRQSYAGIPHVSFECAAISAQAGVATFYSLAEPTPDEIGKLPDWYDQIGSFDREHLLRHAPKIPDIESRIRPLKVSCLTFSDLCEKHGLQDLDVLHIDAEGHDLTILSAVDLARWRPKIVIFESKHAPPAALAAYRASLGRSGYDWLDLGDDTICIRRGLWRWTAWRTSLLWQALRFARSEERP